MPRTVIGPTQMLTYAGLFTWVCVGIPLLWEPWYFDENSGLSSFSQFAWRVAYFLFVICYLFVSRRLGKRATGPLDIAVLGLLTASAIGVSQFSDSGLGGILLMVVSGVLPWLLSLPVGVTWMVLQHAALAPVFAGSHDFPMLDAILQAALYIGFSSFVFVTSLVARQQAQARDEQRRLNSELRATRALLAESTRLAERMRIARELHDLLGHHLTALSLNLEVASHVSTGKAQDHVRQAQSLAKLLLTDVREAVSQLREDDAIELTEALQTLTEGVPGLEVTLAVPEGFSIVDPQRAQVVLRCAQELITNAVRHAEASRMRLEVNEQQGAVHLLAADDGRGAESVEVGNGLSGMRERVEQFGGKLSFSTAPGQGFEVNVVLPMAGPGEIGRR